MTSADERLEALLLPPHATIREAMERIDHGAVEIALVVDDERRLLGTVSDGDVRRALLAGAALDDPVEPHMAREPRVVDPDSGRAEVLDRMRAQSIAQLPVVSAEGRLVGLHVLRDVIGAGARPNWAVIMAGGKGTRLGPLTAEVPKPMLQVAGRPILERLVLHLVGSGVRRIFLSVNYLAKQIEDHFGDGSAFGCEIDYLREEPDQPLDTAGSLAFLADVDGGPDEPLLVMNGDLVTAFSVERFLREHEQSGARFTLAVRAYTHDIPFGVAAVDDDGRLRRLTEKPQVSWPVSAGIYVLDPGLLTRIPRGEPFAMTALVEGCLDRGERVQTWEVAEEWQDIGRPHELERARGAI